MTAVSEEEFLNLLKYGNSEDTYPTELTMIVSFGCPHCEGFEKHEFLGFRTNRNKRDGKFLEEVWKCKCCGTEDAIRHR